MMVSSTGQALLSLIGSTVIPDFVTHQVLRILYFIALTKFQKQPPPPGSPTHRRHYAYAFSIVVLSYLTYNLVQSVRYMPPNFYQILGVPPTVDDTGLKLAFRQFAKRYHPDRPQVGRAGEELFMFVRDAYEALKNPTVRFAYDRFGPAVLTWKDCTTPNEYIRRGLFGTIGYQVVAGAALMFWSMIGRPSPVSFWRYTLYASLFMTELVLILTPSPYSLSSRTTLSSLPSHAASGFSIFKSASNAGLRNLQSTISPFTIFHTILPSQVTYQHVQLLHQFFMFLSVALSRVAPQLFPQEDPRVELILMDRINALLAHADREVSIGLHTQLHSVSSQDEGKDEPDEKVKSDASRVSFNRMRPLEYLSPSLVRSLVTEMANIIVESSIRKDGVGPLRAACDAALEQKLKTELESSVVKDEDAAFTDESGPAGDDLNAFEPRVKDES